MKRFRIPGPGGAAPEPRASRRPRKTLLYVEDEEDNRNVAMLCLKKEYDLLLAPTSRDACRILSQQADQIEAILMDIELQGSELDGIMLTKLIRGKLEDRGLPYYARTCPVLDTPIFFVTAYGSRYSEEELTRAGGDKLINKPVNFVELMMALTQIDLKKTQRTLKRLEGPHNKH